MLRIWIAALSLSTALAAPLGLAQSAQPAPHQKPQAAPERDDDDDDERPSLASNSSVPQNAPVITIKGLCDAPKPAAKADCKTVVTRAEFEKLANNLQPNMPTPVRKQLASAYPRYLLMAKEAQKLGLDKDPHYLETLKFAKLQILNQEMNRRLQADAAKIPPTDIENYYKANLSSFERATVQRVFVPRTKKIESKDNSGDEYKAKVKEGEEAMSKVADDLRARAAAGEDFDKLQKEAYEAAGIPNNAPPTSMPSTRRSNLPPSHASIFDLKEGEVSPVIHDPSGSFFYKMQAKSTLPLADVQDEIKGTLQNQRLRDMQQKLQASISTDLNDAYFSTNPPPPAGAMKSKPTDADDKDAAKPAAKN
jgi:PPIC-type PPIASE domain